MIYIGRVEKNKIVDAYRNDNGIVSTVVIYYDKLPKTEYTNVEYVTYEQAIQYVYFYRLLQEINNDTLIVLDECLRTQNRYDLTYNCIRHFLAQTRHQIIFQRLPQIDTQDDFMILFDFDTQSRWKERKFDLNLVLDNSTIFVNSPPIKFSSIDVQTSVATKKAYERERKRRFDTIGAKDPDTIPRNLYLIGGKDKLSYITAHSPTQQLSLFDDRGKNDAVYVARNQRLKCETYHGFEDTEKEVILVEFPHRFIDMSDFITVSNQYEFNVLRAGLKVDTWYWKRYQDWSERVNATISSLSQG